MTNKDEWPDPGSYESPLLLLPGLKIGVASWPDKDYWVWYAEACGYATQADSLPEVLKALAEVFEIQEHAREARLQPKPWWERFGKKT